MKTMTSNKSNESSCSNKSGSARNPFYPFFILTALVAFLAVDASYGAYFSQEQMEMISDAQEDMQYFYHYLKPEQDLEEIRQSELASRKKTRQSGRKIKRPVQTLAKDALETLPSMHERKVWNDPEKGELTEAQLWQAAVSVLYEFFDLTRQTFPPDFGGREAPPGALIQSYEDNRARFHMALDRLYRAKLGDSFHGRGRAVLAHFDLVLKEMDSMATAVSIASGQRYADTNLAMAKLTQMGYEALQKPPRGPILPEKKPSRLGGVLSLLLSLAGMFLLFLAVWTAMEKNKDKIAQAGVQFIERSQMWAREYSRQFVQVKVEYMVIGPAVGGMVLGLLTFNVFGFVLFSTAGALLGYRLPKIVLDYIRRSRGRKVEAQLMDALVLLSNALKSGLDIVQGFEMVARDLIPPISEEFALMLKNYQLGTPFEKALEGMEERVESRLLSFMIRAISIQRQVGGNLTRIFDRIVENIREEGKLEEKVQSMTAQQRLQANVVGVMPFVMMAIMWMFQPDVMGGFYFSFLGFFVLGFCLAWIGIGRVFIKKAGTIQV